MCGHFGLDPVSYDIREQLGAGTNSFKGGTFKLAAGRIRPTDPITLISLEEGEPVAHDRRWGLDIHFSNRPLINARRETLADKPTFARAFAHRRCLIPASCWYEWRQENNSKVGYRFAPADGSELMHFAGLWWPPSEQHPTGAGVIVTCSALPVLDPYHHRMPLVLSKEQLWPWLQGQAVSLPGLADFAIEPKDGPPRQVSLF